MTTESFDMRLARLADAVRALDGGETAARELLQLAAEVDGYLDRAHTKRYEQARAMLGKWNEFLNASVEDAHQYGTTRLEAERRRIARLIATDERWSGGYADALALME